jgi:hypothetical protein
MLRDCSQSSRFRGGMRRFAAVVASACLVGGGAIGVVASSAARAGADTQGPITFESGYSNGSVNGQDGWTSTGSYDQAIVDNSAYPSAPPSFGNKSLQISNAVTTQSFGDQTFSKSTVNAAGESGADAGPYSAGTLQSNFKASFNFASTTPLAEQPGLHMSVSPDRGDGSRMSYVRIEDSPAGFNLFFDDYIDAPPLGSGGNLDNGCGVEDDFTDTQVATGISRGAHNLTFLMKFVPGPHNDVVKVLLDGNVIATGTSWEDYYRYCGPSGGTLGTNPDQSRITRNILFREAGDPAPATAGQGFLLDGVTVASNQMCTTTCYVDAVNGNDTASGQAGDPLQTIQAGVDAVQAGGTVQVAAGTYHENVVATKSVDITGAGNSTIVEPAVSNPDCNGGGAGSLCIGGTPASDVFLVQANDVTIDHLLIDGDNPGLNGVSSGGANEDARNGIITNHALGVYNNLSVHDVTVQNIYLRGIYASTGGTFDFTNNVVDNVQGVADGSVSMFNSGGSGIMSGNHVTNAADAISANHSRGTQFTGNVISLSASGVHTDNAGDGGGVADVISGNTVSACTPGGYGIWAFVPYIAPSITGNTVSGCSVGLAAFSSCALNTLSACPSAVLPTDTFTNNTVTDVMNGYGLYVSTSALGFGDGDVKVNANHNTIGGPGKDVYVEETGSAHTTAAINNNSLNNLVNSGSTTVDGRCNWWGNAQGAQPGEYFGSVMVAPFLTTSNLSGACLPIASLGSSAVKTPEGNSGSHIVTLHVTLNGPSAQTAVVHWSTLHGTAGVGDFAGAFGTLTFAPGETTKPINITVNGDTTLESNEAFTVNLTAGPGAAIGTASQTIVIQNDEKPTLLVTVPATVAEGSSGHITISLAQQYTSPITVTITTVNGSAHAGSDFTAISTTRTFAAETTTIVLPQIPNLVVAKDGLTEGAETLTLRFTSPGINNTPKLVTVTIPANHT